MRNAVVSSSSPLWIFCAALPHSLTSSDPVIRRGRRAHMEHFTIICVFVYVCLCWDYAAVEGCQWARATLSYIVHLLRCIFPSLCPHRLFWSLSFVHAVNEASFADSFKHLLLTLKPASENCSSSSYHHTRGRLPLANLQTVYKKWTTATSLVGFGVFTLWTRAWSYQLTLACSLCASVTQTQRPDKLF